MALPLVGLLTLPPGLGGAPSWCEYGRYKLYTGVSGVCPAVLPLSASWTAKTTFLAAVWSSWALAETPAGICAPPPTRSSGRPACPQRRAWVGMPAVRKVFLSAAMTSVGAIEVGEPGAAAAADDDAAGASARAKEPPCPLPNVGDWREGCVAGCADDPTSTAARSSARATCRTRTRAS